MSKLAVFAVVIGLVSGACQTTRQAWIATGVGAGVAVAGGLIGYSVRNDDEAAAPLALASTLVIVGGITAVLSLIDVVTGHGAEPARPPARHVDRAGCLQQRREMMERAAATPNLTERGEILASMPDCGAPPP